MSSDPAERPPSTPPPKPAPPPPSTSEPPAPTPPPESAVKFTRAGALWSALFGGFLILILLLVFVLQNTDSATVHFIAWEWNLPVGVALLLSAVGGGLLTIAVGTARIVQLRRAAKKNLMSR